MIPANLPVYSPDLTVYLSYKEDGLFQLELPPVLPCIYYKVVGVNNEWLYFDEIDSTGKSYMLNQLFKYMQIVCNLVAIAMYVITTVPLCTSHVGISINNNYHHMIQYHITGNSSE